MVGLRQRPESDDIHRPCRPTRKANFFEDDIAYIAGAQIPNENSRTRYTDLLGSLITRISGKESDGAKARAWAARYGDTEVNVETGVLNAHLRLSSDAYEGPDVLATPRIFPTGYLIA